ncbi:MAG TPA: nitrate/nitrite transporter [Polyangia bacterium]|jgi:NNP family nitrate/nitrite transporter-like MFS transporter|nr:nitrate/nitrite transporter [Polyangia bacterium]
MKTDPADASLPEPASAAETGPARDVLATRVLVLSTVAFTLLFAVWLMFGVLGVPIKEELHLNKIQFSWLTAIAVLSGSIWRLPFGIWTDRVGGRRLFILLLLISAIPCFLVSRTTTFHGLLACAFFFGIAGNSFSVGIAWNAAWAGRQRQGFALGTFGAGNVGASVTKLIGPALITAVPAAGLLGGVLPGGWRIVPVLYTALLVAMAVVLALFAPAHDRKPGMGRPLSAMLAPLRQVRIWRFGLYYVAVFGAYVAFSLWLPSYYKNVYHLTLAKGALLTAFFIFPASLLRPVGGWLSDRYGARPVTYAVFVAMLLASMVLAAPDGALGFHVGPTLFFALVEVLGIGMGLGKASVYKYIPEYFPDDVGAAGGLVGTLGALGGFFLPIGFGYLESASGRPESCFWVMAALMLSCLLWLHLVVMDIRRRSRSSGTLDTRQASESWTRAEIG